MDYKANHLGKEKITALLWKFSVPSIIGMVANALYSVVDSIFVGHGVGEVGLTAVTIAFPLMMIQMGIGMFVGLGSAALVSIRLGQKDIDGAQRILGNAFTLFIIVSVLNTALLLLNIDSLLIKMGATPDVLPYAKSFVTIIIAGSYFQYVSFGLNNLIRAQGDPKTALATILIAVFLNSMLNPLFIFVFKWGIQGSAYATVLAQAVSATWVLVYFLRGVGPLKLKRVHMVLQKSIFMEIAKIGLAPFCMQIGASLVLVIFNHNLLNYGGELGVASFGIINRVLLLILMPVMGISQGAQPIIGYNYGAAKYERVVETVKKAVLVSTGLCVLGFIIIQVFDESIIRMFNSNPELVQIGSSGIRLFSLMLPILGFQVISANYFQATGKAGYAIVFNLLRQIILLIPLVILLPHIFGLTGIWLAGPISDLGASILTSIFIIRELRLFKRSNQLESVA